MVPPLKQKRDLGWLLIVLAGLLPLVLGIIGTAIEAKNSVQHQQALAANTLLSQAEKMSDSAWNMITSLRQYHYQPCDKIEKQLQLAGTLNAYFRSIGTLRGDNVNCSSAYGNNPGTLQQMIRRAVPVTGKAWWSLSIAGTAGVPDRSAIVFVRQLPDGEGFWAIIDGQYLLDFMSAVGSSQGYQMRMQFSGGSVISLNHPDNRTSLFHPMTYHASSSRYPIDVTLVAPGSELGNAWQRVMFIFMPMAAIFSLLLMLLTANWLRRRISWRDEIRRAIQAKQFHMNYQPIYNSEKQCCVGVEALMRWRRPNGELVRPDMFINAAESEKMIIPLTHHVLHLIAEDVQQWAVEPGFHLAINVAAEHLQHPDFVKDVLTFARRIADKKLTITLELTEHSLIKDGPGVAAKLASLRERGIKVAIDDFGTGHCSLSYLQTFELDYLKIDRGFINAIEQLNGETPVLDAIIALSHKIQLQVLGEGVESALQYLYLRQHGVMFIQGFFYARPMDNDRLRNWLKIEGKTPLEGDAVD